MKQRHPFKIVKGAIIVATSIRGVKKDYEAKLILDTGASKTVIAPSIAQSAGAQRLSFGKQAMTTASGTIDVDTFQLDSFLAIGLLRRNFPVACHELPLAFTALGIQGLLGLDFIYQKEICIDMRKKLISLI